MKPNTRMGLSIITGGLAFVGAANATDLIVNGSFEDPQGAEWVGTFGTYNFSAAYFTGPPIPASENPGSNYSWRHGLPNGSFSGPCIQTVDLTTAVTVADIDSGSGRYTFSAWLASYGQPGSNPDQPYVTVQFLDAVSAQVGATVVFDRVTSGFFVQFADGVEVFDSTTHLHSWAKYLRTSPVPQGARTARVGITHSPNAAFVNSPDTYTDLVKLDVTSSVVPVPPSVDSVSPPNGASGVRPDVVVRVNLLDGTTAVNTNSIQFSFDGVAVTPSIQKTGAVTTVQYDPPGALPPLSAHTYRIVFSNNGLPPATQTNVFSFTNANYYNIVLPAPIYLETFEEVAEGGLPAGWSQTNHTVALDPNVDFGDLNSAAYATWTVVDSTRFNSPLLSYNSHDPTDDYRRVLSINEKNVVNGAVVEHLAQGKIAFGDSGYRDGGSQIMYLFTGDYNLSGRQNVYLSFHSLWEQNQDSVGAVEYSIDEGATWLPLVYYLDGPDVLRDAEGNIDAVATFGTVRTSGGQGQATYVDPVTSETVGGNYGAFIGVDSNRWGQLGPYISASLDDNPIESKRVEVFRMAAADNQPKVRLRFAHAGTDSWYFGLDEVGLYSLSVVTAPTVVLTPSSQVGAVGNSVTVQAAATGIGPFTYQWKRNGGNVPNQTNATLTLTNLQSADAGDYSVQIGYLGGSTVYGTSALTVIKPPSFVTGQWDMTTPLDFSTAVIVASCGRDMEFYNLNEFLSSEIASTDAFGIPGINGVDTMVLHFDPPNPSGGYKMFHGISANGGGSRVNQYTLIMDLFYPASSQNAFRSLLQTDTNNANDGEFFIADNNGLGTSGLYQGQFLGATWQRVALAVDLSGPGAHPVVAKFINGVKVGEQTLDAADGRWSLSPATDTNGPYALLFGDENGDNRPGYLSSVQIRSGRLADAAIAWLGGPSASKIPGCITIARSTNMVVIRWTGGVTLQSADVVTGPWADMAGATSPHSVAIAAARRFYRPKLWQ